MVAVGLVKPSLIAEILKALGKAIILFVPVFLAMESFGYSDLPIVMVVGFCAYLPAAGGWVLFPRRFPEFLKCYCSLFLIVTLWLWFFMFFGGYGYYWRW